MEKESIPYFFKDQKFIGYCCYSSSKKRPLILICHPFFGLDEFVKEKTEKIAELGCVGFAVDMYGEGKIAQSENEATQLKDSLMNNRLLLRERLICAIEFAKQLPSVNANQIGIIGYCFGGACAIEVARSGYKNVKGVVSFHGLLDQDLSIPNHKIEPSLLIFHGYNDPLVSKQALEQFQKEMDASKADWQMHIFGNTMHAFTNPKANHPEKGLQYHRLSSKRSWSIMKRFFKERFEEDQFQIPIPPIRG